MPSMQKNVKRTEINTKKKQKTNVEKKGWAKINDLFPSAYDF